MTSPNNKRAYVRCPICGRQPVAVKRGNLVSHLTHGGQKCSGTGWKVQSWAQATC